MLAGRPADRQEALAAAIDEMRSAPAWLANMDAVAAHSRRQLDELGPFRRLEPPRPRAAPASSRTSLEGDRRRAAAARERYEETAERVERLRQEQDAFERFETAEGWRRDDLVRLRDQLDHHWAEVVAACVVADDPLAFGIDKLRHARSHLGCRRTGQLDAAVPADRADRMAPGPPPAARRGQPGPPSRGASWRQCRARLQDARRRRWGRHDHQAIADAQVQLAAAEDRAQQATSAERDLRERLAALAQHQQQRQGHIADVAAQRQELDTTLGQLDAALDHTRPDRVPALADDPPDHLVERLGTPPGTPAGRAVWCHHALDIEAALDRNDGASPHGTGWSPQTDLARRQITIADRVLQASSDRPGPAEWAELAEQAGTVLDQVLQAERDRSASQRTPGQGQRVHQSPWTAPTAERLGPGQNL